MLTPVTRVAADPTVIGRLGLVAAGHLPADALGTGTRDGRALLTVRIPGGSATLRRAGFDAQPLVADIAQLYTKLALADEVKHDTYMGTGPSPTGREIADIVKKYLPTAQISFDENARVPAWNFDNSRAVKEFAWKIQSVEEMVLDEINGTREAAGLPAARI